MRKQWLWWPNHCIWWHFNNSWPPKANLQHIDLQALYFSKKTQDCSYRHSDILCTRLCQQRCPLIWIKELCFKHWGKVCITKVGRVVLFHEFHIFRSSILPVVPEPLRSKTRYGIHSPVHKDTKLGLIIPTRKRSGVKRFPGWLVSSRRSCHKGQSCCDD